MSSERIKHDFYATPIDVVTNILSNYDLSNKGTTVLEPSAGNGNVSALIKTFYPEKNVTSIEIRESELLNLLDCSDSVIIGDFLKMDVDTRFDIIIGNPPYIYALEFVKKSLELLSDDGVLIFLLRTAFLESKLRYLFWQENPLTELYTLSKRPSFTGKGTDATSYSWFVWDKGSTTQKIKVI